MSGIKFSLQADYWESLELNRGDIEFIYNHLLETEMPCTISEITRVLVNERIRLEQEAIAARQGSGGEIYFPRNDYEIGADLIFPSLGWLGGRVTDKRPGNNPDHPGLAVLTVALETGRTSCLAANLAEHKLNEAPKIQDENGLLDTERVLERFGKTLGMRIDRTLEDGDEFVRIAGRWFPKALLVDINAGHLNLAEAVLDMSGGGPLSTRDLLEAINIRFDENSSLTEFSFDHALWKDERFDEVGPAGQILWHLKRLEPVEVLDVPPQLQYHPIPYDAEQINGEMTELERLLDDELSDADLFDDQPPLDEIVIRLIYPHWRSGTLPLSSRLLPLFPTAYQTPRIRLNFVNGETGEKFPGWVVRKSRYVVGLRKFYEANDVIPGSLITVKRGKAPGEVIVQSGNRREVREWLRTVLIGSDGNIVLALLKQRVRTTFDDRMAIFVPEMESLDTVWEKHRRERTPFDKIVIKTMRELAKLSAQGTVHVSELYAAINLSRRVPPAPILAQLNARPEFVYMGNHHYQIKDGDGE
jgi:hypothetical protein